MPDPKDSQSYPAPALVRRCEKTMVMPEVDSLFDEMKELIEIVSANPWNYTVHISQNIFAEMKDAFPASFDIKEGDDFLGDNRILALKKATPWTDDMLDRLPETHKGTKLKNDKNSDYGVELKGEWITDAQDNRQTDTD